MISNIPKNWCLILVSCKVGVLLIKGKPKLKQPNKFQCRPYTKFHPNVLSNFKNVT
jgi:hypothetical protein